MTLGMRLYELWRLRVGLIVSLVIALFASVLTSYRVSLFPPGVHPKAMAMAEASTQILVDNPKSVLLDLSVGTVQLDQMTQRALVLGNIITSAPVRDDIARRVHLPARVIQISGPLTPQYPRPIANDPQDQRSTTDLLRSNNQYRINVNANPTVPILDIYTEASSPKTAENLANAAVAGLRDYLSGVAGVNGAAEETRLDQLGRAQAGSVTGSVNGEVAGLVFFFVFVFSSIGALVVARMIRGWRFSSEIHGLTKVNGHLDTDAASAVRPQQMLR
jgi:hypothetical protein